MHKFGISHKYGVRRLVWHWGRLLLSRRGYGTEQAVYNATWIYAKVKDQDAASA
jgi:hypothetical protein